MLSNNTPRRREQSTKKKQCPRCDRHTDHVFDHGKEMFVCQGDCDW